MMGTFINLFHCLFVRAIWYASNLDQISSSPDKFFYDVKAIVEAMASHRPYRPALGTDVALEEISKNRGTLYDRDVVDACLKLFNEKGFKFE